MSTLHDDFQALTARFEKGVSADPTQNMSPEDAKKWDAMNEEHGDKFKTAAHTFKFRVPVGPTAVKDVASRLNHKGIKAEEGTEHVFGTIQADDAEDAASKLNAAAGHKIVQDREIPRVIKTAGFSITYDNAWFAFVGNAPFNVDTIRDINRITGIPFTDDQGTLHDDDIALKVVRNDYSGPLTYMQEKQGLTRETIVQIQFVKGMDKKLILKALQDLGKRYKLKVEALSGPRKPETRKKKGCDMASELDLLAEMDKEIPSLDRDAEILDKLAAVNKSANEMIGRTILEQMGGAQRIQVMLGAQQFRILNNGVGFAWPNRERPKGNYVEIVLNGADLYDMSFFNVAGASKKLVKKYDDVYAEDLRSTFERQTGWHLRMAAGQAHQLVRAANASELTEMEALLKKSGYNPKDAKKLLDGGMGPTELGHRLKVKSGDKGSLEHTHGLQKLAADGDEKASRFDEGKPADPTENMSPEDAAEWKKQNEANKDKFKTAAATKGQVEKILAGETYRFRKDYSGRGMNGTMSPLAVTTDVAPNSDKGKKLLALGLSKDSMGKEYIYYVHATGKTALEADLDEMVAKFEEGKPADPTENMSPEDAKKWRLENLKNKDKFKSASANYLVSLAPDGAIMVDGMVDEPLFNLIYARVMGLRFNQVKSVNLKVMSVQGHNKTYRDALAEMVQFNSGSGLYDIQPRGRNVYLIRNVNIAKNILDDLSDDEETAANARDFGMKSAYEEGARVPDGWDNGHIEDDPEAVKSDEGSETPDGSGNQQRRAADTLDEMYALVSSDGYLYGATDNWADARNKGHWGHLVDANQVSESKLVTLVNIPFPLAEKLKDMGTHAPSFADGYVAMRAAKPFMKGNPMRFASAEVSAAGGLYGHTKRVQADCEGCIKRVQRTAAAIARAAYAKHEGVAEFLATHAKRADSLPAQILVAALKDVGPKVATQMRLAELRAAKESYPWKVASDKDEKTEGKKAVWDALIGGGPLPLAGIEAPIHMASMVEAAEELKKAGFISFDGVLVAKVTDADSQTGEGVKQTTDKTARAYGLYGFGEKVAKLGLQACSDLRHEAGKLAHDMHSRRMNHHAAITDFFSQHGKTAGCMYSRLLSASYPELKTASAAPWNVQGWLEWDA